MEEKVWVSGDYENTRAAGHDPTGHSSIHAAWERKAGHRVTSDYGPYVRICISTADRRNHLGACRAWFLEGGQRIVAGCSAYLRVRVVCIVAARGARTSSVRTSLSQPLSHNSINSIPIQRLYCSHEVENLSPPHPGFVPS